jgi:Putative MetA-pathway of phenol degradation
MRGRALAIAMGSLLGLTAASDPPLREVEATPQRPMKSNTAYTVATGYLQMETGLTVIENYALDTPTLIRFGMAPRTEVSFGLSPIRGIEEDGEREFGIGDVELAARYRFFTSYQGAAALEGFVKLPTADEDKGLGTGVTDAGITFLASRSWGPNLWNFNLGGEFAGVPDATSNEARWTTVLTWSRPFHERWTVLGELALQILPAADVEDITTDWGVRYRINPSFVLDAAVYVGLSDDAPDYQVLVGLTKVIGRPFRATPQATAPPVSPDPAP